MTCSLLDMDETDEAESVCAKESSGNHYEQSLSLSAQDISDILSAISSSKFTAKHKKLLRQKLLYTLQHD